MDLTLGAVASQDPLGAGELARDVCGADTEGPGGAPQGLVGRVGPDHAGLDARGLHDLPDRLVVAVQVEGVPDEVEAGISVARTFPVDDPGEPALLAEEDVVRVQVQVYEAVAREPRGVGVRADGLDTRQHRRAALPSLAQRLVRRPGVPADGDRVHHGCSPWALVGGLEGRADALLGGGALGDPIHHGCRRVVERPTGQGLLCRDRPAIDDEDVEVLGDRDAAGPELVEGREQGCVPSGHGPAREPLENDRRAVRRGGEPRALLGLAGLGSGTEIEAQLAEPLSLHGADAGRFICVTSIEYLGRSIRIDSHDRARGGGHLATLGPTVHESPTKLPPALLERYRPGPRLGAGASGVVMRATDLRSHREVVLKVFRPLQHHPSHRERFRREASVLEGLRHPALVEVLEYGELGGALFSVYPYVPGQTLLEELEAEGRLSAPVVYALLEDVLGGLEVVHGGGLVHRDLKPANLLRPVGGGTRILDFGLVRDQAATMGLTGTDEFLGTPAYTSPGQVTGDEPDPRDDLYALGVIAYEALVGRNPFLGADLGVTLHRHLSLEPSPPHRARPEVPRELSNLVLDLLEKDRGDRPADAGEAQRRLAEARAVENAAPPSLARSAGTERLPPQATAPVSPAADGGAVAPAPPSVATPGGRGNLGWILGGVLAGLAGLAGFLATSGTGPAELLPTTATKPPIAVASPFPPDYPNRLREELESAKAWFRRSDGEVLRGDMAPEGPATLLLDGDPLWSQEVLDALPELSRFGVWLQGGGRPEALSGGLRAALGEVDHRYRAEGVVTLLGPALRTRATSPPTLDPDSVAALREAAGFDSPARFGGWFATAMREVVAARAAHDKAKQRYKATPELLRTAVRLPGSVVDFRRAVSEMGGTASTRKAVASFMAEVVPPLRSALVAAGRSLEEEPETRDLLAVTLVFLVQDLYGVLFGPLVSLRPEELLGRQPENPAADLLASSLLLLSHLDLDSPRARGRDVAAARVRALSRRAFEAPARSEAGRRRRDLALVQWMEAGGGRDEVTAVLAGVRDRHTWSRPREEARFLLAFVRRRAGTGPEFGLDPAEVDWLYSRLAARIADYKKNDRRHLFQSGVVLGPSSR